MATYLILNLGVMVIVAVGMALARVQPDWRIVAASMGIVLACTAVFDSLIIHTGIVAYAADKISGVFVGKAPVEDFAYAIVAAVLVPYIWIKLGGTTNEDN